MRIPAVLILIQILEKKTEEVVRQLEQIEERKVDQ